MDSVGCLIADALPERAELLAVQNRLARVQPSAFAGVAYLDAPGRFLQNPGYILSSALEFVGQIERLFAERRPQRVVNLALTINVPHES